MHQSRLPALVLATMLSVLSVSPVLGAAGRTLHETGTFERTTVSTFASDGSSVVRTFGIDLRVVLPGAGPILLDAGYGVFSFDSGMHVLFEAGPARYEVDAFCAALS